MADGLYYYKLVSEYPEDVTKNCKLTINEIDHNFKTLKDEDIKDAVFVRDESDTSKSKGTLIITRNKTNEEGQHEKIIVPIDLTVDPDERNFTYDFKFDKECDESGVTLTMSYRDNEVDEKGEPILHTLRIKNIITANNIERIIGREILTKVISDSTLRGDGTMYSPLGLAKTEKTGMLAPAIKLYDLTDGSELPREAKKGTRFVTREYVSDYGYLYNGDGVKKISKILDREYAFKHREIERKYYWRVPSKGDWDALLDSIEPCMYRNHRSMQCHTELGKLAGKFLKSECGWTGQPHCKCDGSKPYSTGDIDDFDNGDYDDIIDYENFGENPEEKKIDPRGVDRYGMTIRPAGIGGYRKGTAQPYFLGYRENSYMWTTTKLLPGQDTFVKVFRDDMSGVYQVAECPESYYSVRLVKDYNGSNFYDTEYINGIAYKAILMPKSGQIWLASNFADKNGNDFITVNNRVGNEVPEVLEPNGGEFINEKRIEMFINEWAGNYWEKKVMEEGTTIVIDRPCFDEGSSTIVKYCCEIQEGEQTFEYCKDIEVPQIVQNNLEYRVYVEDCNKVLKNTDDLVVERVLNLVVPMLIKEEYERKRSDEILSGMIETEREERISADTELWEALNEETAERIAADEVLSGAIDTLREDLDIEREERIAADEFLSGAIDTLREDLEAEIERATEREDEIEQELFDEIERATAREDEIDGQLIDWDKNPFTLSASTEGEYNLVLPSKDENEEHFIKLKFDGNFGEI